MKKKHLAILLVMLTLGTTWALRGRFGHEYGAAWAGAIGVLALVVASGRKDWLHNWLPIAAIGAIGWGMTGMISYGQVVGYGKSGDFLNTTYGLLCLFVIGGLFGFLGGGLTGLMLETSDSKKPDWARLVTQMVAGGIIFWGFLIYQLEWFMTPPRSELWAACLGAAFALGWYLRRNRFSNAWYVAMYTMAGGGFGFAFGNVLQAAGNLTGIAINWWNVMEYSIGFFGGLGMAYGVFSRTWPEMSRLSGPSMWWSALLLFILIPLWTITNSFDYENIIQWAQLAGTDSIAAFFDGIYLQLGLICLLSLVGLGMVTRLSTREKLNRAHVIWALIIFWFWYQFLKLITSGIFSYYTLSIEELTVINLIVVAMFLLRQKQDFNPFRFPASNMELDKLLTRAILMVVILLILLSGLLSSLIDSIPGGNFRFGGE